MNRTVPLGDSLEALASAVLDARKAFGITAQIDLKYSLHVQMWPKGDCGYGGMAPNGSTAAPCVVVEHRDKVRVYHAGQFAYQVDYPSRLFRDHLRRRQLMGAKRFDDPDAPDPECLQLVSYTIITRGDEVFLTQRLEGGGESRLHGKVSAGVGGHVEFNDTYGLGGTVREAAEREVDEETTIGDQDGPWWERMTEIGYIYDPSTEVGSVHLGCVYRLEVDDCTVRETDVLQGAWCGIHDLRADDCQTFIWPPHRRAYKWDRLESWARIVLSNIDTVRGAA